MVKTKLQVGALVLMASLMFYSCSQDKSNPQEEAAFSKVDAQFNSQPIEGQYIVVFNKGKMPDINAKYPENYNKAQEAMTEQTKRVLEEASISSAEILNVYSKTIYGATVKLTKAQLQSIKKQKEVSSRSLAPSVAKWSRSAITSSRLNHFEFPSPLPCGRCNWPSEPGGNAPRSPGSGSGRPPRWRTAAAFCARRARGRHAPARRGLAPRRSPPWRIARYRPARSAPAPTSPDRGRRREGGVVCLWMSLCPAHMPISSGCCPTVAHESASGNRAGVDAAYFLPDSGKSRTLFKDSIRVFKIFAA